MKKHEWRTVMVEQDEYGCSGPSVAEWLYKLEAEGWEIVTIFTAIYGWPTILCRKPFVPAPMRTEQ